MFKFQLKRTDGALLLVVAALLPRAENTNKFFSDFVNFALVPDFITSQVSSNSCAQIKTKYPNACCGIIVDGN